MSEADYDETIGHRIKDDPVKPSKRGWLGTDKTGAVDDADRDEP